jgi:hypothetical protein
MRFPSRDSRGSWLSDACQRDFRAKGPRVPPYRVGEPLQQGRWHWPIGAQYCYGLNGHELTLFLSPIHQQLVHDIQSGEAEFALVVEVPVLVLAFRFGQSFSWSDVPFCFHMQPAHGRIVPPPVLSQESRALLSITLVGAEDGLIHAQRRMTLAPQFTRVLHQAIREQATKPFSPDDCVTAVSNLFLDHPDINARLSLAQAWTKGNC